MVMVVGYLKDLGGKAPFAMAEPWRGQSGGRTTALRASRGYIELSLKRTGGVTH